jgi:hypothetical protein
MGFHATSENFLLARDQCNMVACSMFPMNTTSTAQYAAVAPKTSCLFALVNTETAVAKISAKMRVIDTIHFTDIVRVRKMKLGISSNAVDVTAIMTFMKVPKRSAE